MRLAASVALLILLGGASASAQPRLEFAETTVSAVGLTPGGQVLWLGAMREIKGWVPTLQRVRTLAVADGSGRATFDLAGNVPVKTILAAIDLATGSFAVATPPAYPNVVGVPFPSGGLSFDEAGAATTLRFDGESLDLVVVRPGVGVWSGRATDGGPSDLDRQRDQSVEISLIALAALGDTTAPLAGARQGDIVLGIDWSRMHVFAGALPQGER